MTCPKEDAKYLRIQYKRHTFAIVFDLIFQDIQKYYHGEKNQETKKNSYT